MARSRVTSNLVLAGLAAAGTVAGHWLAYVLVVHDPVTRALILEESGHSAYWPLALGAATVAATASACATLVMRLRPDGWSRPSAGSLLVRLAFAQVTAFSGMELVERLASGDPHLNLAIYLTGLAAQIATAAVAALLLCCVWRRSFVFRDTAGRVDYLPRKATGVLLGQTQVRLRTYRGAGCISVRAPPAAAA